LDTGPEAIRTRLKLTQKTFAAAIGVPLATVQNWDSIGSGQILPRAPCWSSSSASPKLHCGRSHRPDRGVRG